MAERDLINAFDDCITRLNDGESLEVCLRAYPQFAAELRPMLLAGQVVQRARINPIEVQAAQARARARVLTALQQPAVYRRPTPIRAYFRLATLAASFLLIFSVLLGGAAVAAESSLPGDPLYGYKRLTEQVRLSLPGDQAGLQAQFAQRRIDEIRQLQAIFRAEDVDFTGLVEAINGTRWQVAGLQLTVPDNIPGAQGILLSDLVAVHAHTTAGSELIAQRITLIEAGDEPPAPTPSSVPTLRPTVTQTVTLTPTASPTPTPPPPTLTATLPSPTATATPQAQPLTTEESAAPLSAADDGCTALMPQGWIRYTVRSGDTLSDLAARTSATSDQLMEVNCLEDARLIFVGQILFLPFDPVSPTDSDGDEDSGDDENESSSSGSSSGQSGSDNDDGSDNSGPGSGDDDSDDDDNSGSGSSDDDDGDVDDDA